MDEGTTPTGALAGAAVDMAASSVLQVLERAGYGSRSERSVDYATQSVVVYTASSVSDSVRRSLQAVAGKASVRIRIVRTRYATDALTREGARLAALPGVAWAGPNGDFSGMRVGVVTANARAAAIRTSRFPVTTEAATPIVSMATRNADTAPAWGGALIFRFVTATTGFACSVGVGVTLNGSTTKGITTAQHCGGGGWIGYQSGAAVGSRLRGNNAHDTELLTGNGGQARVWIGAWNSGSSRLVFRGENPANGIRICTGGGVTGETCGSTNVRGINITATITGVGAVGPGFLVLTTNSVGGVQTCDVQPGDSGSPSYHYNADGRVTVHGLVVASVPSFRTTSCKGNPDFPIDPMDPPSSEAFAVNISQALTSISATLNTG